MPVWRDIKLQRSHDDMSCSLWVNCLCKYPVVCDSSSVLWCQCVWDDTDINRWVFSLCEWRHLFGLFKPLETMSDISWQQRFSSCCWKWPNTGSDIISTHFSEITSSTQEPSWVRSQYHMIQSLLGDVAFHRARHYLGQKEKDCVCFANSGLQECFGKKLTPHDKNQVNYSVWFTKKGWGLSSFFKCMAGVLSSFQKPTVENNNPKYRREIIFLYT